MIRMTVLIAVLLLPPAGMAADEVELEGTSIIGNRELPKVLYIAPWKKSSMNELGRPVNSLINETLTPLDRDVMNRTIRYHSQLVDGTAQDVKQ